LQSIEPCKGGGLSVACSLSFLQPSQNAVALGGSSRCVANINIYQCAKQINHKFSQVRGIAPDVAK